MNNSSQITFPNSTDAQQATQGMSQIFNGLEKFYIYPIRTKLILGFFIFMAGGIYVTYSIDRYRSKPTEQTVFLSALAGIILGSLISFAGIALMGVMAYNLILYYGFGISPLLFNGD